MRSRDVDARRATVRLAVAMGRGGATARRDRPVGASGWLPSAPDVGSGSRSDPSATLGERRDDGVGDDLAGRVRGLRADPGAAELGAAAGSEAAGDGGGRYEDDDRPPRARWAVTTAAALALLVVGAVLTMAWGVRTAAGAPGVPVPDRPTSQAGQVPSPPVDPEPPAEDSDDSAGAGATGTGAAGAPAPTPLPGPGPRQAAARLPAGEVVVHVVGQVAGPGLARLPAGARVSDALAAVGGPTAAADLTRVNLARPLVDGEQVRVPRPGEELPVPASAAAGTAPGPAGAGPAGGSSPGSAATAGVVLDLNAATVTDLDALPGLGPVLSARVVEFRDRLGRFSSVDELSEVSGIGEVLLERLRPLVRV